MLRSKTKTKENRQKFYDNDDGEREPTIPKEYMTYFEAFKQFIDDLIDDESEEQPKVPLAQKKLSKRKNAIKSKDKRKDDSDYQNNLYNDEEDDVQENESENQSKFKNESREASIPRYSKDSHQANESFKLPNAQNHETTGLQSDQTASMQNNQNLLMQMLSAQASEAQSQQSYSQPNQAYIGGGMPIYAQNTLDINSQSLLLLQRIIQTTPEIQMLHQQEQVALYHIQQSIKAALSQNLGQEVISHLVLDYQKTQEQHQMSIQAAIQKKLTMILCQNNSQFIFNQQVSSQPEQPASQNIEASIDKYRRSSYHLGIAYYIYDRK